MQNLEIKTKCSKIFIDYHGIVHNVHNAMSEIMLDDAKEDLSSTLKLTQNRKFVIIVDMRYHRCIDKETQDFFSTNEAAANTIALALLVKSALVRDAGNISLSAAKINHPTKYFSSEKEAIDWLISYLSNDAINTRTSKVWLGADNIIRVVKKDGIIEYKDDAIECLNAIRKLTENKKLPVLVDLRKLKAQDKECQNYYAGWEKPNLESACALLIETSENAVLANQYMGHNMPIIPTKVFKSEEEAIKWLREF